MFLRDINQDRGLPSETMFLKSCQSNGQISTSWVLVLMNKWDCLLHGRATQKQAVGRASLVFQDVCRDLVANGRAARVTLHHLLPFGSFQHPEQPTELDPQLQDPWEIIQTVVTSMHGRDIAHRIRLIQDKLGGVSRTLRRITTGKTLRKDLLSLQDRAKALENSGQDDETSWNELHWDLIRLTAALSKTSPPPISQRVRLKKWFRDTFNTSASDG